MSEFDLNRHTHRLLLDEPCFAAISRRVTKKPTTTIPTAGVWADKETGKLQMLYNPTWMEGLTDVERTGVLMHEFYHLLFKHVTTRLPEEGMTHLWNVAADLAINGHIADKLPQEGCIPGVGRFEDWPSGRAAEWYFEKLKQEQEEQQEQSGDGEGEGGDGLPDTLDSHEGWGDIPEGMQGVVDERVREVIGEAVQECENENKSYGSVPHDIKRELQKSIRRTLDPEKVLRYFIKTSQASNKQSTVRRVNKRAPYQWPAKRVKRVANIAISIDQSGSVDDEMLKTFFSLLNKFAKLATFTVVPFDSEVCEDAVYVWRKGETKDWKRVRYGGTDFDPPTKWGNERNFDGHIVLTDMCAAKPVASKCQRLWITTPYYASNPYFQTNEKILAIGQD